MVLGGLDAFERELIRARTSEGRKRAKANGVKMGRKPKLTPFQVREARDRKDAGETLVEIARTYGVSPSIISRFDLNFSVKRHPVSKLRSPTKVSGQLEHQ